MGEDSNDSTLLTNGFKWRGGRKRETTGIRIWSEIFTHDFDNGDKVAIILLDTQGVFDHLTSEEQSTAIFALSALLSSTMIFNTMQNIQEDDLEHLLFFTEYGRLIGEQSEEKPFQKLLFVVRDWPFGEFEGYGSANGQRIINETFAEQEEQTASMRSLRKRILSSFENVGAFLLPFPGLMVSQGRFNGDLQLIPTEFKTNVKQLAREIFAPENLLKKKINGRTVSAQNWVLYLDEYVKVLNGNELPKAENLFEVSRNYLLLSF